MLVAIINEWLVTAQCDLKKGFCASDSGVDRLERYQNASRDSLRGRISISKCPIKNPSSFLQELRFVDEKSFNRNLAAIANTPNVFLCNLDMLNTQSYWFQHFPHASQSILPCWSFFNRIRAQFSATTEDTFGFWIHNDKVLGPRPNIRFNSREHDWAVSLVANLNICQYDFNLNVSNISNVVNLSEHNFGLIKERKAIVYRPPNSAKTRWREPDWFNRTEDAGALREYLGLLSGTKQTSSKNGIIVAPAPRIGLVQRKISRRITNLDAIQKHLQMMYPHVDLLKWCIWKARVCSSKHFGGPARMLSSPPMVLD